jgi:hypothetical protein
MLAGAIAVFLGLFAASAATQFWHLLFSQGFLYGWGMGFLYIPVSGLFRSSFKLRSSDLT